MRHFVLFLFLCVHALCCAATQTQLELVEFGKERIYTSSKLALPTWGFDFKSNEEVERKVEQLAQGILTPEQLKELLQVCIEDLLGGTCCGQSLVFLACHPPSRQKLKTSATKTQIQQIIFFQFGESMRWLAFQKEKAFLAEIKKCFLLHHPDVFLTDEELLKNGYSLILEKMSTMEAPLLEETFNTYRAFAQFVTKFEETEYAFLTTAGLKLLQVRTIEKEKKDRFSYLKEFVEDFKDLLDNNACTDILLSFDIKQGHPYGHRILLQLKHCRVYDPGSGIYQYDSLDKLLQDLLTFFYSLSDNSYLMLHPVTKG